MDCASYILSLNDTNRLYLSIGKGEKSLISCLDCIKTVENNFGWYVKNTVEQLLEHANCVK